MHRLISLALLLLTLAALGSAAQAETPPPVSRPPAEQQAVLERFFAAWAKEDLPAALACVQSDPEVQETMGEYLRKSFDYASSSQFTLSRFSVRPTRQGIAIIRTRVASLETPNGKKEPEEGLQTWDFALIQEPDGWKIRGFRKVEAVVLEQFKEATDEFERQELLRREADVINGWLTLSLRREADESTEKGNPNTATLEEAERLATIAFEVAEWMNDDYERAYNHLMRGLIRRRAKKWNPALNDWDKARELFEKTDNKEGLAKVWANSGSLYHHVAEFQKAVKAYDLSIGYWRDVKSESDEARCIQDLGTVHQDAGRPSEAMKLYQQALKMQQRLGGRKNEAQLLGNIASIHHEQERYAEALELYEQAMRICEEIGNRASDSSNLTNLGNLYDLLGQPRLAEQHHRRAVKAAEQYGTKADSMIALHNLCNFLTRNGDPGDAIEAGMAAMKIATEIGDSRFYAQSLNTLGELLYREKEWVRAIPIYTDALDESRSTGNRVQEGVALLGLAGSYFRTGKIGRALVYYEQAQTFADSAGNMLLRMDTARLRADLHRETGDIPRAAGFYRKAIEYVEQIRKQTGARSLQTSYLRQYSFLYHRLAECYVRLGDPRGAFAVSEQLRARSLVDVIRSGSFRITKSMTDQERVREAALESRLAGLTRSLEKAVLTDEVERLKTEQVEARGDLQKFQDLLYARHPQLRAQRADFITAGPDELAARLFAHAPKSALLSYFVLADQTLLFVLRPGAGGKARLVMHRLPVGGVPLIRRAEELWQACSAPGAAFEAPARALYRDLIQPALSDLAGIDHLVVVPGSDLGVLPFSALLDDSLAPLMTKYSVSYAPSATALMHQLDLSHTRSAAVDSLPLLAFGNPIFPPNLGELPATEVEVAEIARLFGPKALRYIRENALESRAKSLLSRARIVHFATHGTLDERAPMYSSVVLTRDDREDGFLQARELSEMELSAEMVVLSACETALGQKIRGEGVVGLAWALFVGGAESTVTSQWQVPDDSTRTLMIEFYHRLQRPGANRAQAIRQAQLTLYGDKRYAHPYHWAPFTLSGQWLPRAAAPPPTARQPRTATLPHR